MADLDDILKENERLKVELEIFKIKLLQNEKKYKTIRQDLLKEIEAERNKSLDLVLKSKELQTQVSTWQKIVDEIAHSINTDVYLAVSNLDKHRDLPRIQKAYHHTKQIRDLTNLLMWYIKRNELQFSGEKVSLRVEDLIKKQIEDIKEGISTLRISFDEHQENILKMNIDVPTCDNAIVTINKEISDSICLVFKDILRNAIKNTDEENPVVKIDLSADDNFVTLKVMNNRAIPAEFSDWFNNLSTNEPDGISKSLKVGLRVIKIWIDYLNLKAKFYPDKENNTTIAEIIFPKEVKVG